MCSPSPSMVSDASVSEFMIFTMIHYNRLSWKFLSENPSLAVLPLAAWKQFKPKSVFPLPPRVSASPHVGKPISFILVCHIWLHLFQYEFKWVAVEVICRRSHTTVWSQCMAMVSSSQHLRGLFMWTSCSNTARVCEVMWGMCVLDIYAVMPEFFVFCT